MATAQPLIADSAPPPVARAAGLAIAVGGHALLLLLLSVQWSGKEHRFSNPPMEVDLIAEVAETSSAPILSDSPPAPTLGEEDAPTMTAAPEPAPPTPPTPPVPVPKEAPAPTRPAPASKPIPVPPRAAPKATAAPTASPKVAPKAVRPTGNLDSIPGGLGSTAAPPNTGAPAAHSAAEVRRTIDVSIKGAVARHWNRCQVSGLDVSALTTVVRFRLSSAGALESFTSVTTNGQTDSNRTQVSRHQECAQRAIELAAPFTGLPEDSYSFWQYYTLDFVKR